MSIERIRQLHVSTSITDISFIVINRTRVSLSDSRCFLSLSLQGEVGPQGYRGALGASAFSVTTLPPPEFSVDGYTFFEYPIGGQFKNVLSHNVYNPEDNSSVIFHVGYIYEIKVFEETGEIADNVQLALLSLEDDADFDAVATQRRLVGASRKRHASSSSTRRYDSATPSLSTSTTQDVSTTSGTSEQTSSSSPASRHSTSTTADDHIRNGRPGRKGRRGPPGAPGLRGRDGRAINRVCEIETRVIVSFVNATGDVVYEQVSVTQELTDDAVTGFFLWRLEPEQSIVVTLQLATCGDEPSTLGVRRAIIESYYIEDQNVARDGDGILPDA